MSLKYGIVFSVLLLVFYSCSHTNQFPQFISEKLTSLKSETVMGNKYLEFKAEEYKNKIKNDCVENMKFKREENTLVFYGLPKFKKDKSGAFEIENFENEISVLKNTALDYTTPDELSEYLFGILLNQELL